MKFLPVLLGLATLVSARCGTPKASDSLRARHKAYADREASARAKPATRDVFQANIQTYVHVIEGNGTSTVNRTSLPAQINRQMQILNRGYENTGFTFSLVNVSYTKNQAWRTIQDGSPAEFEMKSTLRRGSYQDLNLYLDTIGPGGILGYATFPDRVNQHDFLLDGVVIDPNTLPGGRAPYDLGITAVHEVGHWLNLLHTFEASGNDPLIPGCFGPGDYIYDTPAEGAPNFGCPTRRDTCRGLNETTNPTSEPGSDPIHNFMDYSDDRCLTEWSPGQIVRMQNSWTEERVLYTPGVAGRRIARPGVWP